MGEGGASRSEATGEGFYRLGQLCENILQNSSWLLQYVIVPVAGDPETLGCQKGVPHCVTFRIRMLTTVDFDDEPHFKANKIENQVLKGGLPAELEMGEATVAEQAPHLGLRVGRFLTHLLREVADALGRRAMVWCLRGEPLTRRLTS